MQRASELGWSAAQTWGVDEASVNVWVPFPAPRYAEVYLRKKRGGQTGSNWVRLGWGTARACHCDGVTIPSEGPQDLCTSHTGLATELQPCAMFTATEYSHARWPFHWAPLGSDINH